MLSKVVGVGYEVGIHRQLKEGKEPQVRLVNYLPTWAPAHLLLNPLHQGRVAGPFWVIDGPVETEIRLELLSERRIQKPFIVRRSQPVRLEQVLAPQFDGHQQ